MRKDFVYSNRQNCLQFFWKVFVYSDLKAELLSFRKVFGLLRIGRIFISLGKMFAWNRQNCFLFGKFLIYLEWENCFLDLLGKFLFLGFGRMSSVGKVSNLLGIDRIFFSFSGKFLFTWNLRKNCFLLGKFLFLGLGRIAFFWESS